MRTSYVPKNKISGSKDANVTEGKVQQPEQATAKTTTGSEEVSKPICNSNNKAGKDGVVEQPKKKSKIGTVVGVLLVVIVIAVVAAVLVL